MSDVDSQPGTALNERALDTDRQRVHSPAPAHDGDTGTGHGSRGGHDKYADHDPETFRRRFWLTLLLTGPLVVTSETAMGWFGYSVDLPLMAWYGPILGSIVFWWGVGRSSMVVSPKFAIVSQG